MEGFSAIMTGGCETFTAAPACSLDSRLSREWNYMGDHSNPLFYSFNSFSKSCSLVEPGICLDYTTCPIITRNIHWQVSYSQISCTLHALTSHTFCMGGKAMVECKGAEMRKIADRSDQNYHIWRLHNAVRSVGTPGQGLNSKFGTVSLIFFLLPPWVTSSSWK